MAAIDEFIRRTIAGGQTLVVAGRRGEGKTHCAISMIQNAMMGDYDLPTPVVCITNVVFGQSIAGSPMPIEGYPPGVYHEDTLAGTLRRTGEILTEYGPGNVTIIWMLDEAQNFMLADFNAAKENLALTKFLGNARKFGLCNIFLTPAINNLTPRIRCFPTGDEKSGYSSCHFLKDRARAERISGGRDGRNITFYRESATMDYQPIAIKSGSWTRGLYGGKLPAGAYSYDTLSTATFSIGENENGVAFDLGSFIKATSSGLSHEVPRKISDWFAAWDASGEDNLPGEDSLTLRIRETCDRMARIEHIVAIKGAKLEESRRKDGNLKLRFSQEDYAYIEGVSRSTIVSWTKKNEKLSIIPLSSEKDIDNSEPSVPRGYIQPINDKNGGEPDDHLGGIT